MCPLLAQLIVGFFSFFLLQPFTVLMKKTHAVKQSIFLDVYGKMAEFTKLKFYKIVSFLPVKSL